MTPPRSRPLVVSCFLLMFFAAAPVAAQIVTVSGRVTDGLGTPIPAALVEILDPTMIVRASAATLADGRYTMPVMAGSYNVRVTPPAGSGFGTVTLPRAIFADTTIDIVLVTPTTVMLSGRLLDGAGLGIPSASVSLTPLMPGGPPSVNTTTDADGAYQLAAEPGTYQLSFSSWSSTPSPQRPPSFDLRFSALAIDGPRVLDVTLPVHRVQVHVQGPAPSNEPIANAGISAAMNGDNCTLQISGLAACVRSGYNYFPPPVPGPPGVFTDASGDVTLWLTPSKPLSPFPDPIPATYTITAYPPAATGYPATSLTNVAVTSDTSLTLAVALASQVTGRITDSLGQPVAGVNVSMQPQMPGPSSVMTTTDADGVYRLAPQAGAYQLIASRWGVESPNLAPTFEARLTNVTIDGSRTIDIALPFHRVDVVVQGGDGSPVARAGLSAFANDNCSILISGMPACIRSSYNFAVGPAPIPGSPGQVYTDTAGRAALWLSETPPASPWPDPIPKTYTITAYPPDGSGYSTTAVSGVEVVGDRSLTIVVQAPVELTGRVTDALGAPIASAAVMVQGNGLPGTWTATDGAGIYRVGVQTGTYMVHVSRYGFPPEPGRPASFEVRMTGVLVVGSMTLDIALPLHPLDVHVQDVGGMPVAEVGIAASAFENCDVVISGLPACIRTSYDQAAPPAPQPLGQARTDANGNVTLWLAPTPPVGPWPEPISRAYTITALPPAGTPFTQVTLPGVQIAGPTQLVIALQFGHAAPTTTVTLSPAPNAEGEYPDPATVTLNAMAAPGHVVAVTRYRVDGGPVETYASPFIVSGDGAHTVHYWSTDEAGVYEVANVVSFQIEALSLERLAKEIDAFCGAGEISNEGICNSLKVKVAAGALGALLHELDAQRGKAVSEAAYTKLYADTRRLIG